MKTKCFLRGTDTVNGLKIKCVHIFVYILYENMYRVGVKSGVLVGLIYLFMKSNLTWLK